MTAKERAVIEAARNLDRMSGMSRSLSQPMLRLRAALAALAALDADKPCGTCGGSRRITVHDFDGYSATTSGCPDCTGKEASNGDA